MTIARKYFSHLIGAYVPSTIKNVYKKYGKEIESGLLPKYIFNDGSYIETYGNEIASVDGEFEFEETDPSEAYFIGFAGL